MSQHILDTGAYPKWLLHPAWWAVTNLLVSLFGILFLNWRMEPLIFLFWMEVILSIGFALVRAMGALDGKPFRDTLPGKIGVLIFGGVMGIAFIMLTVAFTIKGWGDNWDGRGFENIRWQMLILTLNYAAAVVVHFFMNGKFRTASPIGELASTFVRLLFLLCLLMAITQHLLPKFPELNLARWTGVAIVGLKFAADWSFSRKISRTFKAPSMNPAETEPIPSTYCDWINQMPAAEQELHRRYHDEQYGFPIEHDHELFCRLVLEINQAGLSWTTILKKQESFRQAYDNFDIKKVAGYGEADRARLLANPGIIRNRLKVDAAIYNAQVILALQAEHGSFKSWLDAHHPKTREEWTRLFKKTFRFTGGEIVNEFLVSTGYLPGAHGQACPIFHLVKEKTSLDD